MAADYASRHFAPRRSTWQKRLRGDRFLLFCRLFLGAWVVIQVLPLLYVASISLSTEKDVGNTILYVLPRHPTLINYPAVLDFFRTFLVNFWRLLLNNSIYTVGGVVGSLLVAAPASFAFATMNFWGKQMLFLTIMLALITPTSMLMIPELVTLRTLSLLGGYHTLILPYVAFGLPLPLLILTTFFRELPQEIFDAARVDGCNNFRLFWHIAVPMAQPAVGSSVIFLFLQFWNEFPLALVLIKTPVLMNVPMALASLAYGRADVVPWELLATAIVVSSIPVTIVFALFQGRLVQGLAEGALKG